MASVMSALANARVFTGARVSTRRTTRAVRCSAFPARQISAGGFVASKVGAIKSLSGVLSLTSPVPALAPAPAKRAVSVVANAGGGGPVEQDTVAEDVRFDMTEQGQQTRWGMVFALFVAFVLCNLDKVNMSVAIVPMAASFGWTSIEKGLVQSAFFWGYAFTQIPGGWLAQKYGGKIVLFAGVMLWSFGTLIAPLCAQFSFTALLASRFLVGLGEGVAPSAATGVLARGIPPSQRSKAVTATFGGLDVGSLSGLIIAPPIILYLGGWAAVFYLFGMLGFIWGTWWFAVYMRDTSTDRREMAVEKEKREADEAAGIKQPPIPWGAFFRYVLCWGFPKSRHNDYRPVRDVHTRFIQRKC
jgi:hypothetical protein